MAKGSVRKKGKKWYARFYIEDESGRKVQKEFVGTESKSETEALLRKAIADYEEKKFVGKAENNRRYPLLSAFAVVPSGFVPPKLRKSIYACKWSAVTVFSFRFPIGCCLIRLTVP